MNFVVPDNQHSLFTNKLYFSSKKYTICATMCLSLLWTNRNPPQSSLQARNHYALLMSQMVKTFTMGTTFDLKWIIVAKIVAWFATDFKPGFNSCPKSEGCFVNHLASFSFGVCLTHLA
jgi:hypothetical protein